MEARPNEEENDPQAGEVKVDRKATTPDPSQSPSLPAGHHRDGDGEAPASLDLDPEVGAVAGVDEEVEGAEVAPEGDISIAEAEADQVVEVEKAKVAVGGEGSSHMVAERSGLAGWSKSQKKRT